MHDSEIHSNIRENMLARAEVMIPKIALGATLISDAGRAV